MRVLSIKGKVTAAILLTTLVALTITAASFVIYDQVTCREAMVRELSRTAAGLASQGVLAVTRRDERQACALLGGLRQSPDIMAAAFYDQRGNLQARYPATKPAGAFPLTPGRPGHRFSHGRLGLFMAVGGGFPVGTLYLESDASRLLARLRLHVWIGVAVSGASMLVALALAGGLQRRIAGPILALAEVAKVVSERRDFSVRAPAAEANEIGELTKAFNQLLARLEETEQVRSLVGAIVESSDDAIIGEDLRSVVLSWNTGAERMFGYSATEMIGEPILRVLSPDRPEEEPELLARVMEGRIRRYETVRMRKDGTPVEVSLTASPIRDGRGRIIGISSIARDNTLRRRAEAEIRRLNLDLDQRVEARTAALTAANKELEAFTYSVAHDLRAPLRHMEAFSRILGEEFAAELPAEARRFVEGIRRGSRHSSRLVDDLLNLAKLGRQPLVQRAIALDLVVEEALADLGSDIDGRAIEWRLEPLPTVECDPGLLQQVFANLLSNAVKYTRGRPVATIEVGSMQRNGDCVFFVRDNGAGFNMKYVKKLFGVFQRLHPPDEFEGTGVGLATVERIIRKHGGRVWAEGRLGEGATFYFTLAATEIPNSNIQIPEKLQAPTSEAA
jgi:PAS domain S-box-containing protein